MFFIFLYGFRSFHNDVKIEKVRSYYFSLLLSVAILVCSFIGLFQKKITFLVRKFQKFCVWFFTLYKFIISNVIIRTQNDTNASLISAPVVISYQKVRVTE